MKVSVSVVGISTFTSTRANEGSLILVTMPTARGTTMLMREVRMLRNGTLDTVSVQGRVYMNRFSGIIAKAAAVDTEVIVTLQNSHHLPITQLACTDCL